MKIPKLKYFYLAMPEDQYAQFEQSRRVEVTPVTFDVLSGTMTGRPYLTLCATAGQADDLVRQHYRHHGAVYVLRISNRHIDRKNLEAISDQSWRYNQTLSIAHCGVYRYDLDKSQSSTYTKPIASVDVLRIPTTTQ